MAKPRTVVQSDLMLFCPCRVIDEEWKSKGLWLAGSRGNCRGDEFEANIYSKTYMEGSDPFGALLGPGGELWL